MRDTTFCPFSLCAVLTRCKRYRLGYFNNLFKKEKEKKTQYILKPVAFITHTRKSQAPLYFRAMHGSPKIGFTYIIAWATGILRRKARFLPQRELLEIKCLLLNVRLFFFFCPGYKRKISSWNSTRSKMDTLPCCTWPTSIQKGRCVFSSNHSSERYFFGISMDKTLSCI